MLKCKLFNARSILSKLHIFTFLLQSCEYDIIFIAESWLTAAIPDSFLLSNSPYVILRKDTLLRHGGVIVFVKNKITCKLYLSTCLLDFSLLNALFLNFCFLCIV